MGRVRVIHAVCCVRAEIDHFVTFAGQVLCQLILVIHTCVVVAYSYLHVVLVFCAANLAYVNL